jgi:hypothetical protein
MPTRPKRFTYTPANANLTGFASNVTGATFTLTANNSGDSLAHQVSIKNDTVNNHSGKTVTLVGTDPDGQALTEVVTGPGPSATVESTGYFLTLTSATPSATIGSDTFDIGWVDEFVSQTIPFNWRGNQATVDVVVTGTINYTVQYTPSLIQTEATPFDWKDSNDGSVVGATTDQTSSWDLPIMASRIKVNSYSSGATLVYTLIQFNEEI